MQNNPVEQSSLKQRKIQRNLGNLKLQFGTRFNLTRGQNLTARSANWNAETLQMICMRFYALVQNVKTGNTSKGFEANITSHAFSNKTHGLAVYPNAAKVRDLQLHRGHCHVRNFAMVVCHGTNGCIE